MNWFDSPYGKQLLSTEQALIDAFIHDKFGYFALQLGSFDCNFLNNSRISTHLFNGGKHKNISFHLDAIPLEEDSVDLIVCPHIIEQLTDIKSFFKDLSRVIVPGGYTLFISFNPYSFAGLRSLVGFDNHNPWNCKFKSPREVQSLLVKAGFTIEQAKFFHYQPIFNDNSDLLIGALENIGGRWLPLFGNIYCILAKKIMPGVTPIKPKWNRPKKIAVALNKGNI